MSEVDWWYKRFLSDGQLESGISVLKAVRDAARKDGLLVKEHRDRFNILTKITLEDQKLLDG